MTAPTGKAAASIACALFVLAALCAGCGGEGAGVSTTSVAREAPRHAETGPTRAVLNAPGGGASGVIVYRKTPSGMPVLKLRLNGLEPLSGEEKYVVWQVSSPHDMVPLGTYFLKSGTELNRNLHAGFESLAFLEDGSRTEATITRVPDDDLWREGLDQGGGAYDPAVPGTTILHGAFTGPLVGAAVE